MIGEHLKLNADSLTRVMIPRATDEESDQVYGQVSTRIIDKAFPFMVQFLDNGKIGAQLDACKTIKEVEALRVDLIYPSLFSDIAEYLNEEEGINDSERTFLLAWISDRLIKGAQDWYQANGHQRAQRIADGHAASGKKAAKILGLGSRPGKIIT